MRSTDHNLNNPMEAKSVDIYPVVDFTKLSEIIRLTQEEYDLIGIKDPTIIYIIKDSPIHEVRYGEIVVCDKKVENIYLLGPANSFGEYTLYLNETDGVNDKLIKICQYPNPQDAINALNKFNKVGSHNKINVQISTIIIQYITNDISIHDMLVAIISLFGYRDSTKLQSLMGILQTYIIPSRCKDLPTLLRNDIKSLRTRYGDVVPPLTFYSDLYDLIVSYKFFSTKEFKKDPDEIDLSKVINKVVNIMENKI